jgi:hypothetical protein
VNLNRNSIGQVNGQFDLTGKGDSVGSLLASADGKLGWWWREARSAS